MKRGESASVKRESVDKTPGTCYPVLDIGLRGRFFVARNWGPGWATQWYEDKNKVTLDRRNDQGLLIILVI